MKRILFAVSFLFALNANAAQNDWQAKLENYKTEIQTISAGQLRWHYAYYVGAAFGTCALSTVVTGATFVADTVPVTNILAEVIANNTNVDYKTYENLVSWETLANTGRGAVGGAAVGVVESLQFVTLWLAGNEAQSFEQLKKAYASTVATAEAVFAEQGKCMMSISKVLLVRAELAKRNNSVEIAPTPEVKMPSMP